MVTVIALPEDFNPIEETNLKIIKGFSQWTDYTDFCNDDEEMAKKLMVEGIMRLKDRGKIFHGESQWDCDDPEFAFKFIHQLVSEIFPFQVDNALFQKSDDCIINVMLYTPKIQYLLDPEYSFERTFHTQVSATGEDEETNNNNNNNFNKDINNVNS